MTSGKWSGVQAKAGAPRAANAAACSRSYEGAPSSERASSVTNCTPDAFIAAARSTISSRIPPSRRSLTRTTTVSAGRVIFDWQ